MSLTTFISAQGALARRFVDFVDSLHPERTIVLADLLVDPSCAKDLGIDGWFDRARFNARLDAMCRFFEELGIGLDRAPFIFLQVPDRQKDCAAHAKRLAAENEIERALYARRFGTCAAQVRYLHVCTEFEPRLDGSWEFQDRRIRPGYHYSNWDERGLYRLRPHHPVPPASVLGFQVPDFAELLGVPGWIATDYFARIVIHDIGHKLLPHPEHEPHHDVTMLCAMGGTGGAYGNAWEETVHRECTDPFFFLDAVDAFRSIKPSGLTPEQRFYRERALEHFQECAAAPVRRAAWGLPPKRKGERARRHVLGILEEMRATRFARYALPIAG